MSAERSQDKPVYIFKKPPQPTSKAKRGERAAIGLLRPLFDRENALKPTPWLVYRTLPMQAVGCIYGASGSCKSYLALDLALRVVTGLNFFGCRPVTTGAVAYIATEGAGGLDRRIRAWELQNRELADEEAARLITANGDRLGAVSIRNDPEASDDWLQDFADAIGRYNREHPDCPVRLVVFDTLAKALDGAEETNEVFSKALKRVDELLCKPFKITALLVHHQGKSAAAGMRGGSSLVAGVDFSFCTTVKYYKNDNGSQKLVTREAKDGSVQFNFRTDHIVVECRKQKDDERHGEFSLSAKSHFIANDERGAAVTQLALTATLDEVAAAMEETLPGDGTAPKPKRRVTLTKGRGKAATKYAMRDVTDDMLRKWHGDGLSARKMRDRLSGDTTRVGAWLKAALERLGLSEGPENDE